MDVNVKVPRPLKPKVLLWADVSYHDMQEIDQIQSIPDLESVLCRVFHIDIPEPRRGVLLELHVQTVLFCRENRFNREQTSALLSIVKCMHQANTETSLSNMEQCFEFFSELLLCHSVRRPPFSINLFNSAEVTRILKYIHSTYIRHYNLYKYIFTPQVRLDLSLTYSGMLEEENLEGCLEDTAVPDMEIVMEKESEELRYEDQGIETQVPSTTGLDVEVTTPGSKSELRAMIQQEVREELVRVSGQLEERLKESADHLNSALASLQPSLQGNK